MAGGGGTYAVPARRQPMTAELWDRRYSKQAYAYGKDPNEFVRGVWDENLLPREGSALLLGEGEGRNAVFLAGVGLSCTAVDLSKAGLSKARRLADQRGVRIKTVAADLADFHMGCSCWDAIISVFCHLEPPLRRQVHQAAAEALRPGGVVVIEAFTPAQRRHNSGGPPDEERLVTEEMLLEDFQNLEVVLCRQLERVVLEGSYHTGLASVIQFVACRKRESSGLLAKDRKERYERNIDAIFEEVNSEAHRDFEEEDPFLSVAQAGVHYAIQASEADGRCRYCWLPKELCACCAVSKAIELQKVHFVLLCHPLEFLRSSSSGKLLPCVLGADLFVFGVGVNADKLDQIINDSRTHLLLPGDGSRTFEEWLAKPQEDLAHGTVAAEDRRCELILLIPDGSWEQVQALRRALDRKRAARGRPPLPCLRLQEEAVRAFHSPLIDALKQGAGQGRISTFEACALLLREAEEAWSLSPGTWKDILRELEPMVEALRRSLQVPELPEASVPATALESAVQALQKVAPSAPLRDGLRRCVVCGAAFATPLRMRDHLRGRRHCTAVALQHFRDCSIAGETSYSEIDETKAQSIFTALSTTPLSRCFAEPPDVALVALKREGLLRRPNAQSSPEKKMQLADLQQRRPE